MSNQDAFIVAATRTPVGKAPRGALRTVRPDDLLVAAIRGAVAKVPSLEPDAIEDAVIGCAFPEAEQGMNVARNAVLLAGLPDTVGGMTVNRYCASGLSAVAIAANRIAVGEADVMLAGGVESMSMVPMAGNKPSFNPHIFESDQNVGIAFGMGITAEKVAQRWKVSREDQDEFALISHRRAIAAQKAGEFDEEITPFEVVEKFANLASHELETRKRTLTLDEGPRLDTNVEALAKLKPAFAARGSVTAGNSSQTSDGAAALILCSKAALKRFNLTPLARFVSFSVRGVAPEVMGIGPKEAIPAVLKIAGLKLDQIDWIELNEAFAAQALAVINELGLSRSTVNPMGGAIALGHPLGATGAVRAATLVHGLRRRGLRYGMVTMCVGTGMGAAGLFERV
ncbi:MAG TPA: acetyl-CoA C-acyltransferase [Burkholderiaceae bacterium]|jgi:acetyl-CoA acyltransferase|nr:acetyl-CoA C-acyltransferase [Burkholderiaceae bacterium]